MARNGSGVMTPSVDFTTEAGSPPIEIASLDDAFTDVADEITNSIAADGQTQPTANLPMNGFKHTNVAAGTALTHYARISELIDQDHIYYVDSGSADTYVITPNPDITAYEEGQRFVVRIATTNTGASTLNVNSRGATAIQTVDGNALTAGMLVAGGIYEFTFDANAAPDRFVVTSPTSKIPDGFLSANVPLLDAENVFSRTEDGISRSQIRNVSTGTSAATDLRVTTGTSDSFYGVTGENNVTPVWTNGPTAAHQYIGNNSPLAISFGTNGIERIRIFGDGSEIQFDATAFDFNGAADFSSTVNFAVGPITLAQNYLELGTSAAQGAIRADVANTLVLQMGTSGFILRNSAFNADRIFVADDGSEIDLTATTLDLNGNLDADGTDLDIDGATSLGLHGGSADITLSGTEADITATTVDINGGLDVDGGSHTITGTALVRLETSGSADIELAATGSGDVSISAGGNVQIGAGPLLVTASAARFSGISTTASAANAFLDSGDSNNLLRSTSSIAYKQDVENLGGADYANILNLRPISYHSKAPADDPRREFIGLIAEEVAEVDPRLVHFHDGKPDGVMYDRITVGLLGIVQQLQREIAEMKVKLS